MSNIVNDERISFKELEQKIFENVCAAGRLCMKQILENYDDELAKARDCKAYRNKGKRKTAVKTICGEVEFSRRIYETKNESGEKTFVYLLDEAIGMEKIGQISSNLAEKIANIATEESYRKASRQISGTTGQTISHTGVWNVIQSIGGRILDEENYEVKKMKAGQQNGEKEVSILFEEMDSVWLKSQEGSNHKKGKGAEIKVFTMYEGWDEKSGNPVEKKIIAGVEEASVFHEHREALIGTKYDIDEIGQRVLNGDGGPWIKEKYDLDAIMQLDPFHVDEAITKGITEKKYAGRIKSLIAEQKIDEALKLIQIYADSIANDDKTDKREANAYALLKYLTNNKAGLIPWYKQIIPPNPPKGIRYDKNMGVQESTNCSVITGRMKHCRARWSNSGASNMAKVLCCKSNGELIETVDRFSDGFLPIRYAEDIIEPLSASKAPKKDGKGSYYLDYINVGIPILDGKMTPARKEMNRWLKQI